MTHEQFIDRLKDLIEAYESAAEPTKATTRPVQAKQPTTRPAAAPSAERPSGALAGLYGVPPAQCERLVKGVCRFFKTGLSPSGKPNLRIGVEILGEGGLASPGTTYFSAWGQEWVDWAEGLDENPWGAPCTVGVKTSKSGHMNAIYFEYQQNAGARAPTPPGDIPF
jgi:hypothetical protein